MKNVLIVASVIAFSASAVMADKPNNKGSGGQAVKEFNQDLKEFGSNLGQAKKEAGVTGIGQAVSAINQDSNH